MEIKTKKELLKKLEALGTLDDDTKKNVVCALIGHSSIVTMFFGYVYCGRCGDQIGDSLGGSFNSEHHVFVGHNCKTCISNYGAMNWKDKYLCPDPFAEPKTIEDEK